MLPNIFRLLFANEKTMKKLIRGAIIALPALVLIGFGLATFLPSNVVDANQDVKWDRSVLPIQKKPFAGHVALLGLALTPGGNGHEYAQRRAVAGAELQALPGIFGMRPIGLR